MTELSERDRYWWIAGYQTGAARSALEGDAGVFSSEPAREALEADAADAVTVGMVLAQSAPPLYVWTDEPPTEPGWYWMRLEDCEPRIIYLNAYHLRGSTYVSTTKWSGPIATPGPL